MVVTLPAIAAIVLYFCATLYLLMAHLKLLAAHKPTWLLSIAGAGLAFHGLAAINMIATEAGINFSLWPVSTLIIFTVNFIVLVGSFKKPLHNLFVLLFPASSLVLLCSLLFGYQPVVAEHLSVQVGIHVIFSLLAYSLFTIAAGQALLLAYQNTRLRNHHPGGFLQGLPPLQTMETLLFDFIWGGFILLSLGIVSGFIFIDNFWAQQLAHKTFFSLIAWLVFSILLWGRVKMGWRGTAAIRWTISGFMLLVLAYWGSKFVVEVVLHSP